MGNITAPPDGAEDPKLALAVDLLVCGWSIIRNSGFNQRRRKVNEMCIRVFGRERSRKFVRALVVLGGIVLAQFAVYGPSLIGQKVLLPLDVLASQNVYIPQTAESPNIKDADGSRADLVFAEPWRRFAANEVRAGRYPRWFPYQFGGIPAFLPPTSFFSPLWCSQESPVVLAWVQMLVALVAGSGAYMFFRRVLLVNFWPAVICAWCYPLTGFFVFWEGFWLVQTLSWLPWLLLLVERTVTGTGRYAAIGMAVVTCFVASCQLDVAGQVLLVSGVYASCRLLSLHVQSVENYKLVWKEGARAISRCVWERIESFFVAARRPTLCLAAGWALGLLLAMPCILPNLEYAHMGARVERRAGGAEERPPVGLKALPEFVFPDMGGTHQEPSLRYNGGIQQESSAAGYIGFLATLVGAPLAFRSRRHRSLNITWVVISCVGVAWSLNLPGFVQVMRLPGLNMMSHNRLVFAAAFATLALVATGLDVLMREPLCWRRWMWLPLGIVGALCVWCVYRSMHLPEPICTQIRTAVAGGQTFRWVRDLQGVQRLQSWFTQYYSAAAVLCGLGVVGWILVRSGRLAGVRLAQIFGVLFLAELVWFGYGRNAQSDPALYFPRVPVLETLAKAPPGRVLGFGCLPPNLSSVFGLRDVRGYDGVDPARMVGLLMTTAGPLSHPYRYAEAMLLAPKATVSDEGNIQLPPVMDMLGVRYVIFRGSPFPKAKPLLQAADYWVLENPRALPHVYVPERVEVVTDDAVRLQKLSSPDFDARKVAYVETPVALPASSSGTVRIFDEIPTRIMVALEMKTPGLVVLTDQWHPGWKAYLNGKPVPILHANHAVRGVVVPKGPGTLEFRYQSRSELLGWQLAGTSSLFLLGWAWWNLWRGGRKPGRNEESCPSAAIAGSKA